MKCQASNCPNPGNLHLIVGCDNQHLTETRCCPKHLSIIRELHQQNKLWCHCRKPIITGMYNDQQQNIQKLDQQGNTT